MRRRAVTALFFILLLAAWELALRRGLGNAFIIPKPSDVWLYFFDFSRDDSGAFRGALLNGTLLSATWVTVRRLVVGYVAGLLLGVPLGLFCGRFQIVRDTLGLVSLSLQTLPSVCWAPLAILMFGQSEPAILFIVVMGSLWAIIIATQDGVRNIQPIYLRAAATMGSKGWHLWTRVVMPASLPAIVGGMKQGWAFSWRSLMAGEIYVVLLSGFGLGSLLDNGRNLHDMAQVVGVMVVIMLVGLAADRIAFAPLDRSLRRRWGLER